MVCDFFPPYRNRVFLIPSVGFLYRSPGNFIHFFSGTIPPRSEIAEMLHVFSFRGYLPNLPNLDEIALKSL